MHTTFPTWRWSPIFRLILVLHPCYDFVVSASSWFAPVAMWVAAIGESVHELEEEDVQVLLVLDFRQRERACWRQRNDVFSLCIQALAVARWACCCSSRGTELSYRSLPAKCHRGTAVIPDNFVDVVLVIFWEKCYWQCAPSDERKSLGLSFYSFIILTGFFSIGPGLKKNRTFSWVLGCVFPRFSSRTSCT